MLKDKILSVFLGKIKRKFASHLQKIILFGSRARMDFSPDSDYDLLLIFDKVGNKDKDFVEDLSSDMLVEDGKLFSTFILTQKQFRQMKYEPFIMNAQKEGVLL